MDCSRVHEAIVRSSEHVTHLPRTTRLTLTSVLDRRLIVLAMNLVVAMPVRIMVGVVWTHLVRWKLMQRCGRGTEHKVGH